MKEMKKFFSFAAFALLTSAMAFSLAACGGDDDEDTPEDPQEQPGGEDTEEIIDVPNPSIVAGTEGGHDYVDLGLPSGIMWATCDVGADKPEASGNKYAWGETEPKDSYDKENYKYYIGYNRYTKYDGYTDASVLLYTLEPEDDAATVNWGSHWRMPTQGEFVELFINTHHLWKENYNGTGVSGMKFINKKDAKKYIFVPVEVSTRPNGDYYGTTRHWTSSIMYSREESGDVWSSGVTHSKFGDIISDDCKNDFIVHRAYGLPVRPVIAK